MAYEQLYGPILVQDHVDLGFASLSFRMSRLLGDPKRTRSLKLRDFLPNWLKPSKPKVQDPAVLGSTLETWARRDAASQR